MTRVVKIGGRPQSDPTLADLVAQSLGDAANGSADGLVLVHGGGDEVSALQHAFGVEAEFVDGRRVTGARDIEIIRMALSGSANKRLVASLVCRGVQALGISGEDASLIAATPMDPERLGLVGAPCRVNVALLWLLLDAGYVPVVSPVSRNLAGSADPTLNVNGDDAAAAVAVALGAAELLLVVDVAGVLVDGRAVERLDQRGARRLIANGTAAAGMAAKLGAALTALEGGVERVRIADVRGITDPQRGTRLVPDGDLA
jgi:acetylglutamate kinase